MIAQRFPEIAEPRLSIRTVAYPASGATVEDLVRELLDTASGNLQSLAA